MTHQELSELKYKWENQALREWSCKYGITDCVGKVNNIMASPAKCGYLGNTYIDRTFVNDLSYADRVLYNGVTGWLDQNRNTK